MKPPESICKVLGVLKKRHILIVLIYSLSFGLINCFNPNQDLDVNAVRHPYYTMSGRVLDGVDSTTSIPHSTVTMEMVILLQGDWVDKIVCVSDSIGYYRIDSLYRGQYRLEVIQDGKLCLSKNIGMMKYSDREYDIIIPPPPDLSFYGKITRCDDRAPLSDVQLTLVPLELANGAVLDVQTTTTNSIGNFRFNHIYEGLYSISGFKSWYGMLRQDVYIPGSEQGSYELDFCMNGGIIPKK